VKAIQLYIEDQIVDLFKDESITLTETIQNVKDIGKIFTPFSRSFTVPASKTNNKIFKHYYNFSIIDGLDARVKLDAHIDINFAPFQKGKIKVDGVQMKGNRPYAYKITFFGNTVTLKDALGDDKLDALEWLQDISFEYNSTNVINRLQNAVDVTIGGNTYQDGILVPLISVKDRLYYDSSQTGTNNGNLANTGIDWQQFKPAIKVEILIDAIRDQYNLDFTNSFFNTDEAFKKLYMWLHRSKGIITESDNGGDLYKKIVEFNTEYWGGFKVDAYGFHFYNVSETPSIFAYSGGGLNAWGFEDYEDRDTPASSPTSYEIEIRTFPEVSNVKYNIVVKQSGQIIHEEKDIEGNRLVRLGDLTTNGRYTIELQSKTGINFDPTRMDVFAHDYYGPVKYKHFYSSDTDVTADFYFSGSKEIPEIKVIDFLSGIFKMFNLIAYVEYDGRIVVKTLDEWYEDSQKTYDITSAIDTTQSTIDAALPYKKITFDYEGKNSFFAKNHNALFNYEHGVEVYNAGNDNLHGTSYTVKLPFEHHKYEKLYDLATGTATTAQWGWSVDDNKNTILGKPLLFYAIKQMGTGTTQITVRSTQTQGTSMGSYYIPSNSISLDPDVSTKNINFKPEVNEYANVIFEDTLFNQYYKKYISDTFNFKRRLTKFKARLPLSFLLNYNLNDKVVVFDNLYIINSITTNLGTGFSQLELINAPTNDIYNPDYQTIYLNIDSTAGTTDNTSITIDLNNFTFTHKP